MAFSTTPQLGVDLTNIVSVADVASGKAVPHKLGKQVWGDDGKLYVFTQAGGAITASTAVCTVNATTFQATATGGAYQSPATTMATGDYGWFSKASV
jgi:hypothetical protein